MPIEPLNTHMCGEIGGLVPLGGTISGQNKDQEAVDVVNVRLCRACENVLETHKRAFPPDSPVKTYKTREEREEAEDSLYRIRSNSAKADVPVAVVFNTHTRNSSNISNVSASSSSSSSSSSSNGLLGSPSRPRKVSETLASVAVANSPKHCHSPPQRTSTLVSTAASGSIGDVLSGSISGGIGGGIVISSTNCEGVSTAISSSAAVSVEVDTSPCHSPSRISARVRTLTGSNRGGNHDNSPPKSAKDNNNVVYMSESYSSALFAGMHPHAPAG